MALAEEWLNKIPSNHKPSLGSPSLNWEMSIVRGHPTHPVGSLHLPFAFHIRISNRTSTATDAQDFVSPSTPENN